MSSADQTCALCLAEEVVLQDDFAYVRYDNFPLNRGHMLIIPFRHVANYFDMTLDEKHSVVSLLDQAKAFIDKEFAPDGYNIGVNIGKAAGQSRMHVHVHLIPRYRGDVDDPRGGIRRVLAREAP